jgi:hypothetical protein
MIMIVEDETLSALTLTLDNQLEYPITLQFQAPAFSARIISNRTVLSEPFSGFIIVKSNADSEVLR